MVKGTRNVNEIFGSSGFFTVATDNRALWQYCFI